MLTALVRACLHMKLLCAALLVASLERGALAELIGTSCDVETGRCPLIVEQSREVEGLQMLQKKSQARAKEADSELEEAQQAEKDSPVLLEDHKRGGKRKRMKLNTPQQVAGKLPPTLAPAVGETDASEPTPVPGPTAPPPPIGNGRDGSYAVSPINCEKHAKPIQMLKYSGGFSARELDIASGNYTAMFDIPWSSTKGFYADLNACGINPYDDILYCVMHAALVSYIVRLSPGKIAFVAKLRPMIYNTGGFGPNGRFYIGTGEGAFTVVDNVHAMLGFEDKGDKGVSDLSKLPLQTPKGFYAAADAVVVTKDFDGTGAADYLMILAGLRLQITKWDGKKFSDGVLIPVSQGEWGDDYGAAWSFNNKVFFASNKGKGVFEIPLEKVNLTSKEPITMIKAGSSAKAGFNDGLNCLNVPDPWVTEVKPFDCKNHAAPIQIVQEPYGYSVKRLDLTNGRLSSLYTLDYKMTSPSYKYLNAVGMNPIDGIPYGCLLTEEFPGPMYIVRFDSTRIEFVGKLQGDFNPIGGAFDANGRYYFVSFPSNDKGNILSINGLDRLKGYATPNHTGITDFSGILQTQLGKTMQIADIVAINYPDEEGKAVSHIVGINRDQELVVVKWDDGKIQVHELRTNNVLKDHGAKLNLGSAWNFNGRIMFASNDGVGVFEAKSFNDQTLTLRLEKVGESSSVWNTDGMNCPSADPFAGNTTDPIVAKIKQLAW